jgi:ubiquinone/menaquinone biosynthesis C-methylase UbiE
MNNNGLYSSGEITKTYEQVHDLLLTRYIIKTYSTNKNDVRDVAIAGLNLKKVKRVLELGCGYGFFIEKLKGMLNDNAVIIGVDMVENNREPFLHSVASIQYKGEFITGRADIIKEMSNESFDLIITSYSLYFFPHLLSNISRILSPTGVFIVVTHSEKALREAIEVIKNCMRNIGIHIEEDTILNKLFYSFSIENGTEQLNKYFCRIEKLNYYNSVVFTYENINDCIFYIHQKKNLIYKEVIEKMPEKVVETEQCVERKIIEYTKKNGSMTLNKNDGIFRCYGPKCELSHL